MRKHGIYSKDVACTRMWYRALQHLVKPTSTQYNRQETGAMQSNVKRRFIPHIIAEASYVLKSQGLLVSVADSPTNQSTDAGVVPRHAEIVQMNTVGQENIT